LVTTLYVDGDACPVKDEALRVATRHGLTMVLVGNRLLGRGDEPLLKRIVVSDAPDAADDWIAEAAGTNDIVITADIPLAARVVAKGAVALKPDGTTLDHQAIGLAVAVRDLNIHLRDTGQISGGPSAFTKQHRSRFLDRLEAAVQTAKRRARQSL
jgi:uncharacterized protein YaiI (UPF0178 family)